MGVAQEMRAFFEREYRKESRRRQEWMEENYARPLLGELDARRLARMAAEASLGSLS